MSYAYVYVYICIYMYILIVAAWGDPSRYEAAADVGCRPVSGGQGDATSKVSLIKGLYPLYCIYEYRGCSP